MAEEAQTFMVEDAQLIFKNFSGEKNQFNSNGDRNFNVILDPKSAEVMLKDGWNIKYLSSREEGEPDTPMIQVTVRFDIRPPQVTLITSTSRTRLDAETIGVLDYANIQTVDLIARAYNWDVNGKQGIKAYLQTMFVTIQEDALERKYAIQEEAQ